MTFLSSGQTPHSENMHHANLREMLNADSYSSSCTNTNANAFASSKKNIPNAQMKHCE